MFIRKQKKYNLYTDASFDHKNCVATYSIILMLGNKILKSYSKKSRIEIKSSTEIELFAVYQAMNLILSCYINKSESPIVCIHTDCAQVPIFFENQNNKMKIFEDNETIKEDMRKTYDIICKKMLRSKGSISLKWISRASNKKAHKATYQMMKRIRKIGNLKDSKEDLLIRKEILCELLSNFNKKQISIIIYLLNISNEDGFILTTQKRIAETLDVSTTVIHKTIRKLSKLNVMEKIKNGKYLLLI